MYWIINDNIDEIHSLAKEISESAIMNQIRWDFYHTTNYKVVRDNYLLYEIRDEFINFDQNPPKPRNIGINPNILRYKTLIYIKNGIFTLIKPYIEKFT